MPRIHQELNIIFIGTPEFGAIILEKLIENKFKPILVVTAPDKPVGRKQIVTPPPVKISAQKYNIPVLQPEILTNSKSQITNSKPDLIIVAAYGQILPKEILEIPKYGCLNVHPSLLPKYRGASPIQAVILNGDKTTGVTIILMDEKMDHGPILSQRGLEIEENETAATLHDKLVDLGASLLMETISKWVRKMIKPQPQDDKKATFTKILTREDGEINWEKTAEVLEREIRAYLPWPGSYTFWAKAGKTVQIKILKTRVLKSQGGISYLVGKTLVVPQNELGVQCGKGFFAGPTGGGYPGDFLVIEKLQMEGGKEMTSEEFLRGHPDFIGTILK